MHLLKISYVAVLLACGAQALPTNGAYEGLLKHIIVNLSADSRLYVGPPTAPPKGEDWEMTIKTRDESSAAHPNGPPRDEDWEMTIKTRDESSAAPPKGEDWEMTIKTRDEEQPIIRGNGEDWEMTIKT